MKSDKTESLGAGCLAMGRRLEAETKLRAHVVVGLGGSLMGAVFSYINITESKSAGGVYLRGCLSALFLAMLFLLYLLITQIYLYSKMDLVIFMVAVNARALRSITSYCETEGAGSVKGVSEVGVGSGKGISEVGVGGGIDGESDKSRTSIEDSKSTVATSIADSKSIAATSRHTNKVKEQDAVFGRNTLGFLIFPKTEKNVSFERSLEEVVFRMCLLGALQRVFFSREDVLYVIFKCTLLCGLSYGCRKAEFELTRKVSPGVVSERMGAHYLRLVYVICATEVFRTG